MWPQVIGHGECSSWCWCWPWNWGIDENTPTPSPVTPWRVQMDNISSIIMTYDQAIIIQLIAEYWCVFVVGSNWGKFFGHAITLWRISGSRNCWGWSFVSDVSIKTFQWISDVYACVMFKYLHHHGMNVEQQQSLLTFINQQQALLSASSADPTTWPETFMCFQKVMWLWYPYNYGVVELSPW